MTENGYEAVKAEQSRAKTTQNPAKAPDASAHGKLAASGTAGFRDKFLEKSGEMESVPGAGNPVGQRTLPETESPVGQRTLPETGSPVGQEWMPGAGNPVGQRTITEADRAAMSLAEYKLYLCEKISALPVNPWNMQDHVAVFISDEGLEAMKNDAEYEAWVLDCLRRNFQACSHWGHGCGGKFVIFRFGATREECRIESWRPPCRCEEERERLFRKKAQDALWERRRKKRKALLALYDELAEKKALSRRMAVSEYYAELAALPPEVEEPSPWDCDARAMQIYSSFKANILLRMFSIRNQ